MMGGARAQAYSASLGSVAMLRTVAPQIPLQQTAECDMKDNLVNNGEPWFTFTLCPLVEMAQASGITKCCCLLRCQRQSCHMPLMTDVGVTTSLDLDTGSFVALNKNEVI